jgi:hypothetical protein
MNLNNRIVQNEYAHVIIAFGIVLYRDNGIKQ